MCLSSESINFEQMMLIPYIIAFFVSVTSAILVQKLFFAQNKIDPVNHRSSHNVQATRTGGISIFLALSASSLYFYILGKQPYDFSLLIPLGIMFVVGIYDDFYNADFKLKFLIQIIVAKILIDQGLVITNFYGLFGLFELPWLVAQLFTVFVFLIIVNAFNFIDGIDGLALSIFLKFLILYQWLSTHEFQILSVIFMASIIPLFYFNFLSNKKVFLGDAGSLLIGTIISVYTFQLLSTDFEFHQFKNNRKPFLAILLLLYPLVDLLRVFVIRIKAKKSPFIADKNHLHHKLLRCGFKHYQITFITFFVELLICFICLNII